MAYQNRVKNRQRTLRGQPARRQENILYVQDGQEPRYASVRSSFHKRWVTQVCLPLLDPAELHHVFVSDITSETVFLFSNIGRYSEISVNAIGGAAIRRNGCMVKGLLEAGERGSSSERWSQPLHPEHDHLRHRQLGKPNPLKRWFSGCGVRPWNKFSTQTKNPWKVPQSCTSKSTETKKEKGKDALNSSYSSDSLPATQKSLPIDNHGRNLWGRLKRIGPSGKKLGSPQTGNSNAMETSAREGDVFIQNPLNSQGSLNPSLENIFDGEISNIIEIRVAVILIRPNISTLFE